LCESKQDPDFVDANRFFFKQWTQPKRAPISFFYLALTTCEGTPIKASALQILQNHNMTAMRKDSQSPCKKAHLHFQIHFFLFEKCQMDVVVSKNRTEFHAAFSPTVKLPPHKAM